jgi:hypothetical protein
MSTDTKNNAQIFQSVMETHTHRLGLAVKQAALLGDATLNVKMQHLQREAEEVVTYLGSRLGTKS